MIWAIIIIPAVAGLAAMAIPIAAVRRGLLIAGALGHLITTLLLWGSYTRYEADAAQAHWLGIDAIGMLFLSITSMLFLAAAFYAVGYLRQNARTIPDHDDEDEMPDEIPIEIPREGIFCGCLLLFLAAMSLACLSRHLGLLWVAVETTTLASAPLIYYHRHHRSLEAAWKYLLICSVGIALAMLGNFCLAFAARESAAHLTLIELIAQAKQLDPVWLKAAFIMLLVGYGTKMGLAPMHTWLPDAHSEAPSMVSALLSGALLNCAFAAILRALQVLTAAGLADFGCELLRWLGLVSMFVAAVFILRQADYKRMLAYSSVEHMGIIALGVGLGGVAQLGAILHAVNHSAAKGLLFLTAGNLLAAYNTKNIAEVGHLIKRLPISALLWAAGLLAITGSPPFGTFNSELMILRGAIETGRWPFAVAYLAALGIIFAAMTKIVLTMIFCQAPSLGQNDGSHHPAKIPQYREPWWSIAPPLTLAAASIMLGLYIPKPLMTLMTHAANLAATP